MYADTHHRKGTSFLVLFIFRRVLKIFFKCKAGLRFFRAVSISTWTVTKLS